MDYPLIANILLAISAFLSLVAMLRWDLLMLQDKDYSNKKFMAWLQESDETYSTKRIIPMAALMACATSWARQSWMVVLLIAIAMVAVTITLLIVKRKALFNLRSTATVSVVLGLVATCAVLLFNAHFSLEAGMMLLLFTAFSYVLTMSANWIAKLLTKKNH